MRSSSKRRVAVVSARQTPSCKPKPMWPLLGIAVVVAGFASRLNGLLVVAAAVIVTGLAAGLDLIAVISAFGKAFNANRYIGVVWLLLPAIGALERAGLRERARAVTMVRPLIAPIAEAAAETRLGPISQETRERIRAHAADADNVGPFFGEDIFVAVSSILLMNGFLGQNGIIVQPLQLSHWAIPTAVFAFAIHATRQLLFDRRL